MGTSRHSRASNSPLYGSFAKTKTMNNHLQTNQHVKVKHNKVNQHVKVKNETNNDDDSDDTTDGIDSGMSSEENEDSLKSKLSPKVSNILSSISDKQEVITKCLIIEPQCVEQRNEIPSCSNDVNVVIDVDSRAEEEVALADKVSEFIVIDLTCDVDDVNELSRSESDVNELSISENEVTELSRSESEVVRTNSLDCDEPSESSVGSLCLVPVGNNEIVRRENQKLLSLSLSILLAALLQAMRCFAQFLEDIIVIPHR